MTTHSAKMTHGLPFDAYLALPSMHFSALRHIDKSPLHYRHALAHDRADTTALRVGRAAHALILSGNAPADVAVYEGPVRRGRAWDAFAAENEARLILNRSELARAEAMRAAVMSYRPARDLIAHGAHEVTIEWKRTIAGIDIPIRGRIDCLTEEGGMVEVKTTRSIHPRAFARECALRMYYAQAALYHDGLAEVGVTGKPLPIIVAIENEPPHDVAVYRLGYDVLEAGQRKVDEWLRALADCTRTNRWPGVAGDDVVPLRLPEWALTDGMDDVDVGGIGGDAT